VRQLTQAKILPKYIQASLSNIKPLKISIQQISLSLVSVFSSGNLGWEIGLNLFGKEDYRVKYFPEENKSLTSQKALNCPYSLGIRAFDDFSFSLTVLYIT
jgi:hypothetical protein